MNEHSVGFLIYPGVASLDVAGPAQALAVAGEGQYRVTLLSVAGGLVESDCPGVSFATTPVADAPKIIDTLFLPGGIEAPAAAVDPDLVRAVRELAPRVKRVACVCTGAFVAAEAGLLTGRRVATHWRYCDRFAGRYRDVILERERIWVQDGRIWSSAGVTAGVDLTLALIERDLGIKTALQVARELVVFLKRPGGQSQFSNVLSAQMADAGGPFEALLAWIPEHLDADFRIEALAEKAGMSPRTFARSFVARIGKTPAQAVELIRIQADKDAIEQSGTPLGVIAARCGFGNEQRMRRAFVRKFNATPAELRARFSSLEDRRQA